jgi:hypothetical protein
MCGGIGGGGGVDAAKNVGNLFGTYLILLPSRRLFSTPNPTIKHQFGTKTP